MTGNGYHHLVTLNLLSSRWPDWPDWHCKHLATISKLSVKESRIHQNPTRNPNTYSTEHAGVHLETALSKRSCFLGPEGDKSQTWGVTVYWGDSHTHCVDSHGCPAIAERHTDCCGSFSLTLEWTMSRRASFAFLHFCNRQDSRETYVPSTMLPIGFHLVAKAHTN